MTVAHLDEVMSGEEFVEWLALFRIEHEEQEERDRQAASSRRA